MARMHTWIGIAALSFALTGCVSQDKVTALKMENDRLTQQLVDSQNKADGARSEADAYKSTLEKLMAAGGTNDALVLNLTKQNAELQGQLDELNKKYADAINNQGTVGTALPAPLNDALTAFANQNPDLVDFDSARGIVKFKSDVTFETGSADLSSRAKEVITRFATILNSQAAASYELLVAGHTDNQRVTNPATIKAGNKDNWFLSAHRAISVGSALQADAINPQRIGVVGYGEYRPIDANTSEAGRAKNRRVEVLILPTTVRTGGAVTASSTVKPARKLEQSKDGEGVKTASGADMNK